MLSHDDAVRDYQYHARATGVLGPFLGQRYGTGSRLCLRQGWWYGGGCSSAWTGSLRLRQGRDGGCSRGAAGRPRAWTKGIRRKEGVLTASLGEKRVGYYILRLLLLCLSCCVWMVASHAIHTSPLLWMVTRGVYDVFGRCRVYFLSLWDSGYHCGPSCRFCCWRSQRVHAAVEVCGGTSLQEEIHSYCTYRA